MAFLSQGEGIQGQEKPMLRPEERDGGEGDGWERGRQEQEPGEGGTRFTKMSP